jgi:membrane-associated phospholipid phosphatase
MLLSLLISRGKLTTVDFTTTVKLQDKYPPRFDDNVAKLVDLGSMEIQGILFVIVLVFLPLRKREKIALLGVYGAGLVAVLVGKSILHHPAPPFLFQRLSTGLPFPSMHVQVDYSYPSGHTYRTVFLSTLFLASALVSHTKRYIFAGIGICASVLTTLILIGLVVLGKHWMTDVVGGATLALFLVTGSFFLFQFRPKAL